MCSRHKITAKKIWKIFDDDRDSVLKLLRDAGSSPEGDVSAAELEVEE